MTPRKLGGNCTTFGVDPIFQAFKAFNKDRKILFMATQTNWWGNMQPHLNQTLVTRTILIGNGTAEQII
jgi:hypothetical protein